MNAKCVLSSTEKVSLVCTFGGSDKEYHASLINKGDLWQIDFMYGRRGSCLKTGVKPEKPTEYAVAKKMFDSLVKSKLKDNYVLVGDFAPQIVDGSKYEVVIQGHEPQLLDSIKESDLEFYLSSPLWGAQEKKDGERRQFSWCSSYGYLGSNRKSKPVPIPLEFEKSALMIFGKERKFHIDGEIIGESLFAFDILALDSDLRQIAFDERFKILEKCLGNIADNTLTIVPLAKSESEKRTLLQSIIESNGEGIVFKRLDSQYFERSLKFKLYDDATVIVTGINLQRSVSIGVLGDEDEIIKVGNLTIPPNKDIPSVGSLLDVKYLYYYSGGSLYQPTYIKLREDKDVPDHYKSLKTKQN